MINPLASPSITGFFDFEGMESERNADAERSEDRNAVGFAVKDGTYRSLCGIFGFRNDRNGISRRKTNPNASRERKSAIAKYRRIANGSSKDPGADFFRGRTNGLNGMRERRIETFIPCVRFQPKTS